MNNCGYLDRSGRFIDCCHEEKPFQHDSYCGKKGLNEDFLMDVLGWVKLTKVLPNKYIFTWNLGLSMEQISWLKKNGYDIDEFDLCNFGIGDENG